MVWNWDIILYNKESQKKIAQLVQVCEEDDDREMIKDESQM